jgi:lambda family phage portal protein
MILRRLLGTADHGARGWPSAKTTRLNSQHWADQTGEPINTQINSDLTNLRERSALEAKRNSLVAGVIDTHVSSMVGEIGPTLVVQSDSEEYATSLESIWRDWFAFPDYARHLTGADALALQVRSLWLNGEFIEQLVYDDSWPGEIKLRTQQIHPDQLMSPTGRATDARMQMGVERNARGQVVAYHFTRPPDERYGNVFDLRRVRAQYVLHGFHVQEVGQARGVPYLASCLDDIADLREYGVVTLDAARAAADWSVYLHTDHDELVSPFADTVDETLNEEWQMRRRVARFLPPGYKASQVAAQHPTARYTEFVHDRLRAIGRPVSMPLMIILLDSNDHNYSSARFDGQHYVRGVRARQRWLERVKLNVLVRRIEREAQLVGLLPAVQPERRFEWIWPTSPHVDPNKEATAEDTELANGVTLMADSCARRARPHDMHLRHLAAEVRAYKAEGLVHPFVRGAMRVSGVVDEDDDDDEAKSKGTSNADD